ncbi:hypothetical protein CTI12_AA607700 [Artemisia annua]|uniref:Uncharacterized protein n=1 Tax=Artemisia annua TaxID=35608 RepID=A0A2U1KFR2_ARTAN|nr:hypothetical protein CTI12_AA607700 [Artemisia annua]
MPTYLLDERNELSFVSGFMDWIQSASLLPFYVVVMVTANAPKGDPLEFPAVFLDEVAFRRPEGSHYQRARPTEVPKVRAQPVTKKWPSGCCLPFLINELLAGPGKRGNNRKEGVHVAAGPVLLTTLSQGQQGSAVYYKREKPLQITIASAEVSVVEMA